MSRIECLLFSEFDLMGVLEGDSPLSNPVALFVVQLLLITILSRLIGAIIGRFKQPLVIAEMV